MQGRLVFGTCAVALYAGWIAQAAARSVDQPGTGRWMVAALADDASGVFQSCEARSEPERGVALILSADRGLNWSMWFSGALGAQPGQTHPVRYRVDRGPVFNGQGTAVSPNLVQMPIADSAEVLPALASGGQLTADGGNDRLAFSLRDSQSALDAVRTCVERWNKEAPSPNAVRVAEGETQGRSLSEPERRLEAITVAVNILSRARIADFQLQPPDAPARFAGHDVTWRAQDLTGSFRLVGLDGRAAIEKIRADLISADILACNGQFTAESRPEGDGKSASLFTRCPGDKGWSVNYLIMPRPSVGAYVLSLLGPPDKADALRPMADSLRSAALEVVGGAPKPSSSPQPSPALQPSPSLQPSPTPQPSGAAPKP